MAEKEPQAPTPEKEEGGITRFLRDVRQEGATGIFSYLPDLIARGVAKLRGEERDDYIEQPEFLQQATGKTHLRSAEAVFKEQGLGAALLLTGLYGVEIAPLGRLVSKPLKSVSKSKLIKANTADGVATVLRKEGVNIQKTDASAIDRIAKTTNIDEINKIVDDANIRITQPWIRKPGEKLAQTPAVQSAQRFLFDKHISFKRLDETLAQKGYTTNFYANTFKISRPSVVGADTTTPHQ